MLSQAWYAALAASLTLSGARAEPPPSFRLAAFSSKLYNPQQQHVLEVLGDSINATNSSDRMQVGYRDQFDIPFNGWVVHADNGNSDIGYTSAQSAPLGDVVREPNWYSYCGPTSFTPLRYRDTIWIENPPSGVTLVQSAVNTPNLAAMRRGDPFSGEHALSARLIAFGSPCEYAGFTVRGCRGEAVCSSATYTGPDVPENSLFVVDCSIAPGPGLPSLRILADDQTALSADRQNGLITVGTRFRSEELPGTQMQFLAHSGWRTTDHVSPVRFSDAALAQFYVATDPPTHVVLWIGQNLSTPESTGFSAGDPSVYRSNVRAIMDRHNAVIGSLGAPPPRWLLVSQYKTGYSDAYHQMMAQAQYELAQADPRVSTLNLYRLAGGDAFDGSAYLSDGIHPNAAGVTYLASLMNSAMLASSGCTGDFDGDGFVAGEDFDGFASVFIAGQILADFNEDGFVTGEDFDAFVMAFDTGC